MTKKGGSDTSRRAGVQQDTHLRLADGRIQASRREFKYCLDLVTRDRKLLHKFFNGHAIFKILKDDGNGHARSLENPRTAYLTGNTLNGGAL